VVAIDEATQRDGNQQHTENVDGFPFDPLVYNFVVVIIESFAVSTSTWLAKGEELAGRRSISNNHLSDE